MLFKRTAIICLAEEFFLLCSVYGEQNDVT